MGVSEGSELADKWWQWGSSKSLTAALLAVFSVFVILLGLTVLVTMIVVAANNGPARFIAVWFASWLIPVVAGVLGVAYSHVLDIPMEGKAAAMRRVLYAMLQAFGWLGVVHHLTIAVVDLGDPKAFREAMLQEPCKQKLSQIGNQMSSIGNQMSSMITTKVENLAQSLMVVTDCSKDAAAEAQVYEDYEEMLVILCFILVGFELAACLIACWAHYMEVPCMITLDANSHPIRPKARYIAMGCTDEQGEIRVMGSSALLAGTSIDEDDKLLVTELGPAAEQALKSVLQKGAKGGFGVLPQKLEVYSTEAGYFGMDKKPSVTLTGHPRFPHYFLVGWVSIGPSTTSDQNRVTVGGLSNSINRLLQRQLLAGTDSSSTAVACVVAYEHHFARASAVSLLHAALHEPLVWDSTTMMLEHDEALGDLGNTFNANIEIKSSANAEVQQITQVTEKQSIQHLTKVVDRDTYQQLLKSERAAATPKR